MIDREHRFVASYVQHLDINRAVVEAGYASKQPHVQGILLMRRPRVRAAIVEKQQQQLHEADLTALRVKRELAAIAFVDPAGCFDPDGRPLLLQDMPPRIRAAVKSVQVTALDGRAVACKVEFWSKTDALKLAAQHLNLLAPKELTVTHRFPHAQLTDAELKQRLLASAETLTVTP